MLMGRSQHEETKRAIDEKNTGGILGDSLVKDLQPGGPIRSSQGLPIGTSVGNESSSLPASPGTNSSNILYDDGGATKRIQAKMWPARRVKMSHLSVRVGRRSLSRMKYIGYHLTSQDNYCRGCYYLYARKL